MAESNRVALSADGKKVSEGSADVAFVYDAADADRAAALLKTSAANKDTNERAVTEGLTTLSLDGTRTRTDAAAGGEAAGEESAAPKKK